MSEIFEDNFDCNHDMIEPGNPNDLMDEFFNSEIGTKAIDRFYSREAVQEIISNNGMDHLVNQLTAEHNLN